MRSTVLLLAVAPAALGQFYNISTVAGMGRATFPSSGQPATNVRLYSPFGVAVDRNGNTYVSDDYYHQVFRISSGTITIYAGNGQPGFSGDGGPATSAQLFTPLSLATDTAGNLYIADSGNGRVRKVSTAGIITTVAGNGRDGVVTGDGGNATDAAVGGPAGVAVDGEGNLYIGQPLANVVRRVNTNGVITTVAGNGQPGYSGDGGPATSAMFNSLQGIEVDSSGNLYIADTFNQRIRRVSTQGVVTTVAGNGTPAYAGDGGPATQASLFNPYDVAFDATGNMYIADFSNTLIRRVSPGGTILRYAGGGSSLVDTSAFNARLTGPTALALDAQGNVIVALLYIKQVRRVTTSQSVSTVAGTLPQIGSGDNIAATNSLLIDPLGLASDNAGTLYIADPGDNRVRRVSTSGTITTIAGNGLFGYTGDGGSAPQAELGFPRAVGLDPAGNVYVTTPINAAVRRVTPSGTISTFAGGSKVVTSGDGGPATQAGFDIPTSLAADRQGNVYIADAQANRIRRVDTSGTVTTYAGTGTAGFLGDGGPARDARFFQPAQIAFDSQDNLYVADQGNHRVRKITPQGVVSTIAGNGTGGFAGDGGLAGAAQMTFPAGIALDSAGNLYIAADRRIRKVDANTGTIRTIAGTGKDGFSGDGGLATLADLSFPTFLAVDGAGNVYTADETNQRVRKLAPADIVREGVANGATLAAGAVAPGEIVTIFMGPGIALGPAGGLGVRLDAAGRVDTILGGVQALFDGVPAPLTFVNATQLNCVVPYAVAGKTTTQLQLRIQNRPTNAITLQVTPSAPGIFAITHADGTVNSQSNPADPSGVLVLYATGEGDTNPRVPDGTVNTASFPKPLLPVSVQIGGQNATVQYAGAAPGFVAGVLQVNVQIPPGLNGNLPLRLQVGTASTPAGLTVHVRP